MIWNIIKFKCYKDVFSYEYFIKNISGFIIIGLFILHTFFIIYYFMKTKIENIRYICSLTEIYILYLSKKKYNKNSEI